MSNTVVRLIPPKKRVNVASETDEAPKLRVAAYCRVSTDDEEQASSYEAQIYHYTNYIEANPEWTPAGIFADEGISGTSTKKRVEFNRLIDECMAGNIDMVITKSISRFARNTLDCLKYIRKLKEKGIPVIFEKENINTMDSKGEILITIMASLAQQESQSLSQNVKMGMAFRFQNGEVMVNHNRFLGYTKDENKKLVIVPEEAEVVKRIYREYLEGKSLIQIGRGLEADNILTGAGKPKWLATTLHKILTNEKYIGDALLQKTVTTDFLTKERKKNDGRVNQYYVENCHEAIIPRDLALQVKEEMVRRANLKSKDKKRGYSSKYALSSLVQCGICGEVYRRIYWYVRGSKTVVWRCVDRLENGASSECSSLTIKDEDLRNAVLHAINQAISGKDEFLKVLRNNISSVIGSASDEAVSSIDSRLEELQKELIRLANSHSDYDKIANEIHQLREQKQAALLRSSDLEYQKQRIAEMAEFLNTQGGEMLEFDETLVRRLVEKVMVYEDRISVEFKSGMGVSVEM